MVSQGRSSIETDGARQRARRPRIEKAGQNALRTLAAHDRARELARAASRAGEHRLSADIDALASQIVAHVEPVRLSVARGYLAVSDPTVRDWTARGILECAGDRPIRVTLESVALAAEELRRLRVTGETDLAQALERHVRVERRLRSTELQQQLARLRDAPPAAPRSHRTAELSSIALHRLLAERLDERTIEDARKQLRKRLRSRARVHAGRNRAWQELLDRPLQEIRRKLVEDTQEMHDMRQDTPFAVAIGDAERVDALLGAAP